MTQLAVCLSLLSRFATLHILLEKVEVTEENAEFKIKLFCGHSVSLLFPNFPNEVFGD